MNDRHKAVAKPETRPARSEEELERMKVAHRRGKDRHKPVSLTVKRDEATDKVGLEAPHDDPAGWMIRLRDGFGTQSDEFALAQVRHLSNMIPAKDTAPSINLNALLAAVDTARPETEAEAALAVQMAATHHLAMTCLSRASCATQVQQMEANGNLATKMLRTYAIQLEALAKLRRGGSQKVTVEHVHVYQGGQAIVGNVGSGGGGRIENGHQPQALAGTAAFALPNGSPVLCQDTGGAGMPIASGEREEAVPDARRRQRQRRPQG